MTAHRFVLASAGTGKTFALTHAYIGLLARGASPSEIVATTFTRAAAGEILGRVAGRLADAVTDPDVLRAINAHAHTSLDAAACSALLRPIARDASALGILTLDAWFQRLAAACALELSVAPGWRVADEEEDAALRAEAVASALEATGAGDVERLIALHARGRPPAPAHRAMLGAVGEAYDAYVAARGREDVWGEREPLAGALHPEGVSALLEACAALPADAYPKTKKGEIAKPFQKAWLGAVGAADAGDWRGLLDGTLAQNILRDGNAATFGRAEVPPEAVARLAPILGHARAEIGNAHARATRAAFELLRAFDHAYRGLKRERGLLRFDDVPGLLLETDTTDLYYKLDARVRHVLLDEFQDTSATQFELLQPLLEELLSQDDGRSVLVVGDVKQSLYGWRGAEPGLLTRLAEVYAPAARVEHSTTSYRSSPVVLDFVNDVFREIGSNAALAHEAAHAAGGRAFAGDFRAHKAATPRAGSVRVWTEPAPEEHADADERRWVSAQFAAARVHALLAEAPGATVGVLTRSNKPAPDLVRALSNLGIASRGERGNPLTDAAPVGVGLAVIRLLRAPGDSAAAYQLARSPARNVLGELDPLDPAARERLSAHLRDHLARRGLAGLLAYIEAGTSGAMTVRERARFRQLIELAEEWMDRHGSSDVATFETLARERGVDDPPGTDVPRVRVMTAHKAKGLEFDAVVLTEMDSAWSVRPGTVLAVRPGPGEPIERVALYPNAAEREADDRLAALHERETVKAVRESLSVLYVGLTRARHALEVLLPRGDGSAPTSARVVRAALGAQLDPADPHEATLVHERSSGDWGGEAASASGPGGREEHSVGVRFVPRARARVARASGHDAPSGLFDHEGLGAAVGELVHGVLARVDWSDRARSDEPWLPGLDEGSGAVRAAAEAVLRRVAGSDAVRAALARARYDAWGCARVEARLERAIAAVLPGGRVVSGRIDRLVLGYDDDGRVTRAEVIDFKTGSPNPAHAGQVETYRETAAHSFGIELGCVAGALVYCGGDGSVESVC